MCLFNWQQVTWDLGSVPRTVEKSRVSINMHKYLMRKLFHKCGGSTIIYLDLWGPGHGSISIGWWSGWNCAANELYHSQTNLQLHYHAYNAPKQMFWTLQCLSTCTTTLLLHAYIVTWCKMPLWRPRTLSTTVSATYTMLHQVTASG